MWPFLDILDESKNLLLIKISVIPPEYSLPTSSKNAVLDSENSNGNPILEMLDLESSSSTSICRFNALSSSLIVLPFLPIIDGIDSLDTNTLILD